MAQLSGFDFGGFGVLGCLAGRRGQGCQGDRHFGPIGPAYALTTNHHAFQIFLSGPLRLNLFPFHPTVVVLDGAAPVLLQVGEHRPMI